MRKIVRERSYENVCTTVVSIADEYGRLAAQYTCVIHCMQPHPLKFYKQFSEISGIRVIRASDAATGLKKWLSILTVGYPAYIFIEDPTQIPKIFGAITQQAMGGIYIFETRGTGDFLDKLSLMSPKALLTSIHATESHVCYVIDEDSSDSEGNVTEIVEFGENCPQPLVAALGC